MKRKYVSALLASIMIAASATATAVPLAIYANSNTEMNTIAVENEIAETETAGRSIYVGAKASLDIREKVLDKLGYKDKNIDLKDVRLELKEELIEDKENPDIWIPAEETPDNVMTVQDETVTFNREGIFKVDVTVKDKTTSVLFDVDEELFAYVNLNDWVIVNGTKKTDFLDKTLVTFDETKVKSVELKDTNVNFAKNDDYLLAYEITDADGKTYEKSVIVSVTDKKTADELSEEGVWLGKNIVSITLPTEQSQTPVLGTSKQPNKGTGHSTSKPAHSTAKKPSAAPQKGNSQNASKPSESTDTVETPAHQHKYDKGVITKQPTCTEAGEKKFTCIDGDDFYTVAVPATGHSWNQGEVTVAPTCTKEGTKTFTCTECGKTKQEAIPAAGHDYVAEITKEATCGEDGIKTYTCSVCGDSYTEVIPATEKHNWDAGVITKQQTCTEKGVKTFTCTVCGEIKTEEVAALGHAYDNGVITTEPTCTKPGVKTFTCTHDGCTHSYTEEVKPLGHDYVAEITKEATCGTDGIKTYTLSLIHI